MATLTLNPWLLLAIPILIEVVVYARFPGLADNAYSAPLPRATEGAPEVGHAWVFCGGSADSSRNQAGHATLVA